MENAVARYKKPETRNQFADFQMRPIDGQVRIAANAALDHFGGLPSTFLGNSPLLRSGGLLGRPFEKDVPFF